MGTDEQPTETDSQIIKTTSDLFIAALFSVPKNAPLVMAAFTELQRFAADPEIREFERWWKTLETRILFRFGSGRKKKDGKRNVTFGRLIQSKLCHEYEPKTLATCCLPSVTDYTPSTTLRCSVN